MCLCSPVPLLQCLLSVLPWTKNLQRPASALGMFLACSPQWPRSDDLDRAKAIAQDLLNLVRTVLEPELAFEIRGRRPSISTFASMAEDMIQPDRDDKDNAKTAVDVEVQPPTGEALARPRWPFRHARVAQVSRSMVPGVCSCRCTGPAADWEHIGSSILAFPNRVHRSGLSRHGAGNLQLTKEIR